MPAASQLDRRIGEAFAQVDHVEGVYAVRSGKNLTLFTVIDEDEEETYDSIYEQERKLIREFGGIRFDFNVIARRGRSIVEIVGGCRPIWQRSESASPCLNVTNI